MRIDYAHVNEDNRVELELFLRHPGSTLFCIAGSGERLIGLLGNESPKRVYAIDNNPEALLLLELKLAALRQLPVPDYLRFTGLLRNEHVDRISFFEKTASSLSPACREFWNKNIEWIKQGIANAGHFEQFLGRVRPLLRIFLSNGFYETFQKPLSECRNFPYRRWRFIKNIFSHRWAFHLMGNKDVAFTGPAADLAIIPRGLQKVLDRHWVGDSFMFHLVFKGFLDGMPMASLPPSISPEALEKTKARLAAGEIELEFASSDLLSFLKKMPENSHPGSFFSLSDLLSFENFDYLKNVFHEIGRVAPGSKVVFRAFVRHRLTPHQATALEQAFGPLEDHSEEEKTCMYQVFSLTIKPGS